MQSWDPVQGKWVDHPCLQHVKTLWRMGRDKRLRVLEALGWYEVLEVLELGGDRYGGPSCPIGREQLAVLVPELHPASSSFSSHPCLAGLRVLSLYRVPQMNDAFLCALARAGCGPNLTSLHLYRAFFFLLQLVEPFFFQTSQTCWRV